VSQLRNREKVRTNCQKPPAFLIPSVPEKLAQLGDKLSQTSSHQETFRSQKNRVENFPQKSIAWKTETSKCLNYGATMPWP